MVKEPHPRGAAFFWPSVIAQPPAPTSRYKELTKAAILATLPKPQKRGQVLKAFKQLVDVRLAMSEDTWAALPSTCRPLAAHADTSDSSRGGSDAEDLERPCWRRACHSPILGGNPSEPSSCTMDRFTLNAGSASQYGCHFWRSNMVSRVARALPASVRSSAPREADSWWLISAKGVYTLR